MIQSLIEITRSRNSNALEANLLSEPVDRPPIERSDLLIRVSGKERLVVLVPVSIERTQMLLDNFPHAVIDRADTALYFAKSSGRKRTPSVKKLSDSGQLSASKVASGEIDFF